MILRITKELPIAVAKELLALKKSISTLYPLLNTSYLYEALNLRRAAPAAFTYTVTPSGGETLFQEPVGLLLPSKYTIKAPTEKYILWEQAEEETNGLPFEGQLTFDLLGIKNGYNDYKFDFVLQIAKLHSTASPTNFHFGWLNYIDKYKRNLGNPAGYIVFNLISYFYDKRSLYRQVYFALLKNEKSLETITGEMFTQALLELFSVEEETNVVPNFSIPQTSLDKEIYFDVLDSEDFIEKSAEGLLVFSKIKDKQISKVKLSLNNNLLLIDFYLRLGSLNTATEMASSKNIAKLIENKVFEEFLENNLASWFKDLFLLQAFETKIFKKMETNILLEKI